METLGRICLKVTIAIVMGWIFYATWQWVMDYQEKASILGKLLALVLYMLVVLPGLIYSWTPLPKEFGGVILLSAIGVSVYLVTRFRFRRTEMKSHEGSRMQRGSNLTFGESDSPSLDSSYSSNSNKTHSTKDAGKQRVLGHAGYGKRVNQQTGAIQEKGMFGWRDTGKRIDPESGNYQKEGLMGQRDTGTRIDQESGVIQEDGLFGHSNTDTRVNPDTGVIEKDGLFGWVGTDQRINPETGKSQHLGLFGWVDD